MKPDTGVRWAPHELIGELVEDPSTGRVGRLVAVLEHIDRETNSVVRVEAHVRPVDGSGREWTANANDLVAADGS
ncbi:hypothetical protein E1265_10160 [Streptomyces sp. 8K308]|uniref:hypothetical protein n=1 Tax=Streptomyces sp. 8K308 TaxID=2530388 RepID=UPI001050C072|nr:hypothetical protein [Streptomyces sp. 8K308]TDC24276.1 hypothetical protein E1265_10160 [Streptomyces sp. 8K308]